LHLESKQYPLLHSPEQTEKLPAPKKE